MSDRDSLTLTLVEAIPEKGTVLCGGCADGGIGETDPYTALESLAWHPFVVDATMAEKPLDSDRAQQVAHDVGIKPGRVNPLVRCLGKRAAGECNA